MDAVIVGNSEERVFQHALTSLKDAGVGLTLCADVYNATVEIALSQKQAMLIIGTCEEFSKEQFAFISIVLEQGHFCCCIAQEGTAELDNVAVARNIEELEKIMEGFGIGRQKPAADVTGNQSFIKDDIDVTREELNALFGTE